MRKFIFISLILVLSTSFAQAQTEPGLSVGAEAPNFETVNFKGDPIQLDDITQKGPVVLLFYRGSWCRFCNLQLQAFQSRLTDFEKRGVSIIAISVDKPEKSAEMVQTKEFGFEVISNPEADLLEQYAVMFHVPEKTAKMYKEKYHIDLVAASGRTDYLIAVPAVYVVDQTGTIVFAYANEDYKVRKSPDEILEVLDNLSLANAWQKLHE